MGPPRAPPSVATAPPFNGLHYFDCVLQLIAVSRGARGEGAVFRCGLIFVAGGEGEGEGAYGKSVGFDFFGVNKWSAFFAFKTHLLRNF